MVDDRDAQLLLGPGNGRRVGALTGEEEIAEQPEIASSDQAPVGIFALDRSEGGGRGEEDAHAVLLDGSPESTGAWAPMRAQASMANAASGTIGM